MENERNYGIDFLRLVLMYMVCVLHTLGCGGVLNACESGTLAYRVFWFFEIFSYCAVDGFALISGYTSIDKPRKFEKLTEMWFQAFFYSFILTLILTLIGQNPDWQIKTFIKCALPITFNIFWYFTAFFVLFFVIPVLNRFIFTVDEKQAKIVFIISIALFSFIELIVGSFQTQNGYSSLWLIVLYFIGALAKQGKVFEKKTSFTLVILWLVCIIITWYTQTFIGSSKLTTYISPTILASGFIMVILFSRIKLKGTIISKISPLAFGIYLFQVNPVVWNQFLYNSFSFIPDLPIIFGIINVLLGASLIFCLGLVIEFFRQILSKKIGIPSFSKCIVSIIKCLLNKITIFLN